MKVEDVKSEWIDAFMHAFYRSGPGMIDTVSQSLAAVIPAIQNAALERAAMDVEQWAAAVEAKAPASPTIIQAHMHAAAIRALKEGT
jgi:hypothetical protein